MALSIFLHGTKRLPALNCTASRILAAKNISKPMNAVTPVIVRNFTSFNRDALVKKATTHNLQTIQSRNVSHSAIWAMEKTLSVALLGVIPLCLMNPSPILDNILATTVVLHMHWGVESVVVDYIRPVIFGSTIPKIAHMGVYVASILTLAGLLYFNYNDIGLANAIKKIWNIQGGKPQEKKK